MCTSWRPVSRGASVRHTATRRTGCGVAETGWWVLGRLLHAMWRTSALWRACESPACCVPTQWWYLDQGVSRRLLWESALFGLWKYLAVAGVKKRWYCKFPSHRSDCWASHHSTLVGLALAKAHLLQNGAGVRWERLLSTEHFQVFRESGEWERDRGGSPWGLPDPGTPEYSSLPYHFSKY